MSTEPGKDIRYYPMHHVAIRTRDITSAIDFYSLLGFHVETKFRAGSARAVWLSTGTNFTTSITNGCDNSDVTTAPTRLEIIEIPSHVLNETQGTKKRAINLHDNPHLLGLNHFALDVTQSIQSMRNMGEQYSKINLHNAKNDKSTSKKLQLQDWMNQLEVLSKELFSNKGIRIAMKSHQKMIGNNVYELAVIYDADGTIVELINFVSNLEQTQQLHTIDSGWDVRETNIKINLD